MSAGPLPWTGTAARAREIGYGQAMLEVCELIGDILERRHADPAADTDPVMALESIRDYAFDTYALCAEPRTTLRNVSWFAGRGLLETWQSMFGPSSGDAR